jgi:hypothetical protein
MKPRSIIGPVLLILVGALFLVNNLHPELPWLDLLSKYWPYLLIAWGTLRLIEVLVWWFRDKPVGRGISAASGWPSCSSC